MPTPGMRAPPQGSPVCSLRPAVATPNPAAPPAPPHGSPFNPTHATRTTQVGADRFLRVWDIHGACVAEQHTGEPWGLGVRPCGQRAQGSPFLCSLLGAACCCQVLMAPSPPPF